LGRAAAFALAEEGADLLLLDVASNISGVPYSLGTESQLLYTTEECRKRGVAASEAQVDVRDLAAAARAVETAIDRYGRIDVLVNNAGIAAPSGKILHEITEDEWQLLIDIDLSGAWRMTKLVGKGMVQQNSGSIINISSTAGIVGYRHFAAYVAAKHGLIGLTRAAALDYAPYRVRVNAVLPGSVRDDPLLEGAMLGEIARALDVPLGNHEDVFAEAQPMNALVEPRDVASAIVWLASDESRQVTGTTLVVDGGFTAK
jgi:NAD(P)-dependent dehydrogenase (short-subunit alcohol dehydrogenase family)